MKINRRGSFQNTRKRRTTPEDMGLEQYSPLTGGYSEHDKPTGVYSNHEKYRLPPSSKKKGKRKKPTGTLPRRTKRYTQEA